MSIKTEIVDCRALYTLNSDLPGLPEMPEMPVCLSPSRDGV